MMLKASLHYLDNKLFLDNNILHAKRVDFVQFTQRISRTGKMCIIIMNIFGQFFVKT